MSATEHRARYRDALPQLRDTPFLTDGGLETTLIFHEGHELPYFAAYDLLTREGGEDALRRYFEPDRHTALAEIALAERRPRDAIEEFRRGDRRPDGPIEGCSICIYMALGRAFDQARMPDSAIVMLERFVAIPSWRRLAIDGDGLYLAPVYKRLGELYEEKGDHANAASYYSRFVELWSGADAELQPRVRDVRARLVRLTDAERR